MKMRKYRAYAISPVPKDLRDRISEIHALAILKGRGEDGSIKGLAAGIGKAVKNKAGRVR
jgi:hypothetical protein